MIFRFRPAKLLQSKQNAKFFFPDLAKRPAGRGLLEESDGSDGSDRSDRTAKGVFAGFLQLYAHEIVFFDDYMLMKL